MDTRQFRNQPQIIIGAGDVIDDDLFLTGETVEMNGTVNGDLFATGQRITINGEVNGNLFVSGSDITLNGRKFLEYLIIGNEATSSSKRKECLRLPLLHEIRL